MRRSTRSLAMLALLIPTLAACGGGGDDDAVTGSSAIPSTTEATAPESTRLAVVVDTDLSADDIVALTYLTSNADVDLLAVTVSGTGEVRCPRGADVARGLLARTGRADVPVACGSTAPISGARTFPEPWRDAADKAYGLLLEMVTPPADAATAADLLATTVSSSVAPVVLLTLGPLTNVAEAFAAHPDLARDVDRIVTMGGAVEVPGNVIPDGASDPIPVEWNLFVDPSAAATVVASGTPLTLVALDATNQVPLGDEIIERLQANDTSDATDRVLHLFEEYPPPYLWDTLAAIAVTDPALVPTHPATITVLTAGDEAGRTVAAAGGAPVDIAAVPDAGAVIDRLLRTLAGVPDTAPLAVPTTLPLLGDMTVGFDGTTCTYDGPRTLAQGAYDVSTVAGAVDYPVAVAHLVEGATVEEVLAWVATNPDEEPPMVDEVQVVGSWGEPSPARVDFRSGTVAIACGSEDGSIHLAAAVDVTK